MASKHVNDSSKARPRKGPFFIVLFATSYYTSYIMTTMQIFNEYIHVDAKHKLEGEWLVTYEPPDHVPSLITGFIYKGNVDPNAGNISFRLRTNTDPDGRRAYSLTIDSDEVDRGFIWDDGVIEMRWKEDPGEHFLCVSYRTREEGDKYKEPNKNWLQEGF